MVQTRIYVVEGLNSSEKFLVEAASSQQAIKHVVRKKYRALIPSTKGVAQLIQSGVLVEAAFAHGEIEPDPAGLQP